MWLFDQPIYIVVLGIVLGVLVGAAWTASGRKELFYALGGVVALTVILLLVERFVVTDREAIRATLGEIARDVQSNNVQRVVAHIAQGNAALAQRAQGELPNYTFRECRVTKVHDVDIDAGSEPRSAIVEFNVVATGTFRQGSMELTDTVPRWVKLQMVREKDGRWRVQNYEHAPPQQFMFDSSPDSLDR